MHSSSEKPVHTLVIARYKENISWLKHVPKSFRIFIYNKGKRLPLFQRFRCRRDDRIEIINVPNQGRETETYLRYIKETEDYGNPKKFTVFCQGDPFEHSPDFLKLLNHINYWESLQPLSFRWRKDREIPPQDVLNMDKTNFINGLRIRVETFSLYTLQSPFFYDEGVPYITEDYLSKNKLSEGTNISEHFLKKCQLPQLAESAASHNFGRFTFGAIFAVKNQLLNDLPEISVKSMLELSLEHYTSGYLFERHWFHIFGKSFLFHEREIPYREFQEDLF